MANNGFLITSNRYFSHNRFIIKLNAIIVYSPLASSQINFNVYLLVFFTQKLVLHKNYAKMRYTK